MINLKIVFNGFFEPMINCISNNFELFFYVELSLFIVVVSFFVIVMIRQIFFWIKPIDMFRHSLFFGLMIAESLLILFTGYIYWNNYKYPPEKYLVPEVVLENTSWAAQDIDLYFVSEKKYLDSVSIKGGKARNIFKADSNIEEYSFSPDGKYLLVETKAKLYKIDILSRQSEIIDSVGKLESGTLGEQPDRTELKGVISGVRWSPDSKNICYEISRWSKYASQDNLYVYNLSTKDKKILKDFSNVINSMYWGINGKDLYYLKKEALDTSFSGYSFDFNVYKIPLSTLVPENISQIPYDGFKIPIEDLQLRGIDLFLEGKKLTFSRSGSKDLLMSDHGAIAGIDEKGFFYVLKESWFKKKLFRVRRIPNENQDFPRYQYGGGELAIKNIRWLPGGAYIIMQHKTMGVLILDPWNGKIGKLRILGRMIGWYNKSLVENKDL